MTTTYSVPSGELAQSDIMAAIRAEEDQSAAAAAEESSAKEDKPAATAAPPKAETPDVEAVVRRVMAEALLPYEQRLQQLSATVTATLNKGQAVPQEFWDNIAALNGEIREIKLNNIIDPEEKFRFVEEERVRRETAVAENARRQAALAQQQQTQQLTQAQQREQYEASVDAQHGQFFNDNMVAHMIDVAAARGISAEEAEKDLRASKVIPVLKDGVRVGYDWKQYQADQTAKWDALAAKRESGRTESRSNGDGGRPGAAIPKGFDAFDLKKSISQITAEAVASGQI